MSSPIESLTEPPRLANSPQDVSLSGRVETKRSSWPLRPEMKNNSVSSADTVGLPSSFGLLTIGPSVCAGANSQAVGPGLCSEVDEQNEASNAHTEITAK